MLCKSEFCEDAQGLKALLITLQGEPYLEQARSPQCQPSHQPGSRLTHQKNREYVSSVLESWSGWWEILVKVRTRWRQQTDWRKRHCSLSILSWDQFSASIVPVVLLEKPFSHPLDCGRSQGKQVFLVLAFLDTPHIAYSRIYDSLTKQIVASIKANPWNSGHEFPHFNHAHWLSFLLCSCPLLQLVQRSIAWPCSLRALQDVSVMWRQLVTGGFQRNSSERILTHFRVELCACDRENSLDISPQASQVRR